MKYLLVYCLLTILNSSAAICQNNMYLGKSGHADPILIIIAGESNARGYALNSQATVGELEETSSVKILNNATRLFENLHIGVNSLVDSGYVGADTHSIELGLSNMAESGYFGQNPIYLVKTGQGGSKIDEWDIGDAYYVEMKVRVNAAKDLIVSITGKSPTMYLFYTQGINDAIAMTNINTWKAATIAHLNQIKTDLGYMRIAITKFEAPMTARDDYNTAIDEICASEINTLAISTLGLSIRDTNHWDYEGMKILAKRAINKLL